MESAGILFLFKAFVSSHNKDYLELFLWALKQTFPEPSSVGEQSHPLYLLCRFYSEFLHVQSDVTVYYLQTPTFSTIWLLMGLERHGNIESTDRLRPHMFRVTYVSQLASCLGCLGLS